MLRFPFRKTKKKNKRKKLATKILLCNHELRRGKKKQKEGTEQSGNSGLPADPSLIITTVCLVFMLCQKSRGNIIVREMRPVHTFS